jgi:hypothetical protein
MPLDSADDSPLVSTEVPVLVTEKTSRMGVVYPVHGWMITGMAEW